jgi:hypothetical protein
VWAYFHLAVLSESDGQERVLSEGEINECRRMRASAASGAAQDNEAASTRRGGIPLEATRKERARLSGVFFSYRFGESDGYEQKADDSAFWTTLVWRRSEAMEERRFPLRLQTKILA